MKKLIGFCHYCKLHSKKTFLIIIKIILANINNKTGKLDFLRLFLSLVWWFLKRKIL